MKKTATHLLLGITAFILGTAMNLGLAATPAPQTTCVGCVMDLDWDVRGVDNSNCELGLQMVECSTVNGSCKDQVDCPNHLGNACRADIKLNYTSCCMDKNDLRWRCASSNCNNGTEWSCEKGETNTTCTDPTWRLIHSDDPIYNISGDCTETNPQPCILSSPICGVTKQCCAWISNDGSAELKLQADADCSACEEQ